MSTRAKVKLQPQNPAQPDIPFATTLHVRDCCLCLHLQRAARALARRFDLALRPTGLTNGQFSMLMSLNRPDVPRAPAASIGNVAELLGMDRTTVTAAARILARRGMLRLEVHPADRRNKIMKLTSQGMRALAAALPIWTDQHTVIERKMKPGTAQRLRGDLRLVTLPNLSSASPAIDRGHQRMNHK